MKRTLSTLILCLTFVLSSQAQTFTIKAYLLSSEDSSAIQGSHIQNLNSLEYAISSENGYFELNSKLGDTLLLSNVNFKRKLFEVNITGTSKIYLTPKETQLNEVVVHNMPATENDFKNKLIGMDIQPDPTFKVPGMPEAKPMGEIPKNYDPSYTNSVGYALNKPLSFITKKLSKSHKDKLKYYQVKAQHGQTIEFDKKFNRELVARITQLNESQLTAFIQYMDIDRGFVIRSTDYEIASYIQQQFALFIQEKQTDSLSNKSSQEG